MSGMRLPKSSGALVSMLDTVIGAGKVYYLAVPVTSGPRLWGLARKLNFADLDGIRYKFGCQFDEEVLKPNIVAAGLLSQGLRKRFKEAYIINPSVLVANDWSPEEYRSFWRYVIRDKVSRVYLAPGWQYSHGCVEECVEAMNCGISVYDAIVMKRIESEACRLVSLAIKEGLNQGFRIRFLELAREQFKECATAECV